jgi:hypothetical protein
MKTEVSFQLEAMEGIIRSNLKECCAEIEDMHVNGLLHSTGFVRKAAAILTDEVFKGQQLGHAERCVNKLAIQFVIAS